MRRNRQPRRVRGLWILVCVIFVSFLFTETESSFDIELMDQDICPSEGFFPDPRSCTKFYRCVETFHFYYAYEFECPRRTVFDPEVKICNHPYAVHPDYRCFITNLLKQKHHNTNHKAKEIIHVINDTTIHTFVRDSDEIIDIH